MKSYVGRGGGNLASLSAHRHSPPTTVTADARVTSTAAGHEDSGSWYPPPSPVFGPLFGRKSQSRKIAFP